MWCPNCNLPVPLAWCYCPRCGAKLAINPYQELAKVYPESEKEAADSNQPLTSKVKNDDRVGIVKVSTLRGRVKLMAEADDLEPDDLVILTVSMEKIIGDPVSYLLNDLESCKESAKT